MSRTAKWGEISAVPNKYCETGGGGYCKWVPSSGLKCNFNITTGP